MPCVSPVTGVTYSFDAYAYMIPFIAMLLCPHGGTVKDPPAGCALFPNLKPSLSIFVPDMDKPFFEPIKVEFAGSPWKAISYKVDCSFPWLKHVKTSSAIPLPKWSAAPCANSDLSWEGLKRTATI